MLTFLRRKREAAAARKTQMYVCFFSCSANPEPS